MSSAKGAIASRPVRILQGDPRYPKVLIEKLGEAAPSFIDALGNLDILKNRKVALFCSRRCPAEKIIEAQDLAHRLRDERVTVISGFHSPVEKECLRVLLKGAQSIIICPARGLTGMRIPSAWRVSLVTGKLLLLSVFEKILRRPTVQSALRRNQFVGALAEEIHIVYAASGSQIDLIASRFSSSANLGKHNLLKVINEVIT